MKFIRRKTPLVSFLIVVLQLIAASVVAQNSQAEPQELWVQANYALINKDFDGALQLYHKVLQLCEKEQDLTGKVNALEAIALVHKKLDRYRDADGYCRRAIASGSPSFRSYYILAQIAFEEGENVAVARRICKEGLRRFPDNPDLLQLKSLMGQRQDAQGKLLVAGQTEYLSNLERRVVEEMNLARTNPLGYAGFIRDLRQYYDGMLLKIPGKIPVRTREGVPAVDEAIRYLTQVKAVSALSVSEGMSRAARDHVNDQSRSGETGHHGADRSEPFDRMERYGTWLGISGENIAYGDDDARMIVMQLIIDDGVPSRGHRDNIYNGEFKVSGVAFGSHPVYRNMCVITYAGGYQEGKTSRR